MEHSGPERQDRQEGSWLFEELDERRPGTTGVESAHSPLKTLPNEL
jgi:hypothetical protein